jgi:hypothetical protein
VPCRRRASPCLSHHRLPVAAVLSPSKQPTDCTRAERGLFEAGVLMLVHSPHMYVNPQAQTAVRSVALAISSVEMGPARLECLWHPTLHQQLLR